MYYRVSGCNFSPWLIMLWLAASHDSWYTTKIPAHHRTSAWPREPHRCWMSRPCCHFLPPPSLLVDAPTLLSKNNLSLPRHPPQPLCGYWMSFVCVWMSSLEKDVPQLHTVFHLPAWTETWTTHPDASEQNRLDVRPCSTILVQFLKVCFQSSGERLEILHWASWQRRKESTILLQLLQLHLHNTACLPLVTLMWKCVNILLLVLHAGAVITGMLHGKSIFWGLKHYSCPIALKSWKAALPTGQSGQLLLCLTS